MAKKTTDQLKAYFRKGMFPTEGQFADLLDSYVHKDSRIPASQVEGLTDQLNSKLSGTEGQELQRSMEALQRDVRATADGLEEISEDVKQAHEDDGRFLSHYLRVVPFDGFAEDYEKVREDLEYGVFFFRSNEAGAQDGKAGFRMFSIENAPYSESDFFNPLYYSVAQGCPNNTTLYINASDGLMYRFDGQDLTVAYVTPLELKEIANRVKEIENSELTEADIESLFDDF